MASLQRLLGSFRRRVRLSETPTSALAAYILSFCAESPDGLAYAKTHIERLARTLEITPKGGETDSALEMGAYMQITPALKHILGYGEVRGCYLGPLGETHAKTVRSTAGESFS